MFENLYSLSDDETLEKIENQEFNDKECLELLYKYEPIDEKIIDESRWYFDIEYIIEICGKFFKIVCQKPKTEDGEWYCDTVFERVNKVTKTVEITTYE